MTTKTTVLSMLVNADFSSAGKENSAEQRMLCHLQHMLRSRTDEQLTVLQEYLRGGKVVRDGELA